MSRRALARAVPRVLTLLCLAAASVGLTGLPAQASASADLVSYANAARADRGLSRYVVSSDLARYAQQRADYMAAHDSLEHSPSLGSSVCCWRKVGENIGAGGSASAIHKAFMGSSDHRANILSSAFTQIGVGTARSSSGTLYVSEVFRQPKGSAGSSSTATPPPARASSPAPERASRSSARAPLSPRAAAPARAAAPSAAQIRAAQLRLRLGALQPTTGVDPLGRARGWVRGMASLNR